MFTSLVTPSSIQEPFRASLVALVISRPNSATFTLRATISIANLSEENLSVCTRPFETLLISNVTGEDVYLLDVNSMDKQSMPRIHDFTMFPAKSSKTINLSVTLPMSQRKNIAIEHLAIMFSGGFVPYRSDGKPEVIKTRSPFHYIQGDHRLNLSRPGSDHLVLAHI